MPKYVIERDIPGCGDFSADQLKAISQTSCGVLSEMGPQIQWQESYVTGTRSTVFTPRRTRRWCASTLGRAVFPRIRYQRLQR